MEYKIEEIVDMDIVSFYKLCEGENVTNLKSLGDILSMVDGESRMMIAELAQAQFKDQLNVVEFQKYAIQIASLGGIVRGIADKIFICKHFSYQKIPDCFKTEGVVN